MVKCNICDEKATHTILVQGNVENQPYCDRHTLKVASRKKEYVSITNIQENK